MSDPRSVHGSVVAFSAVDPDAVLFINVALIAAVVVIRNYYVSDAEQVDVTCIHTNHTQLYVREPIGVVLDWIRRFG